MKVLFVGVGSIAKRHIKNLIQICKNKEIKIDVLRHNSYSQLSKDILPYITCEHHKISDIDKDYDAIFITNPTHLHYKTIDQLKDFSKNFFVEKPVFSTLSETLESLNLPQDNKYYVACPLRYAAVLQYAKKFVKTKVPYSIRAICSTYLPDWRPGIDYRECYSAKKEQGGGVCIDLIHEWDYLYDLFGEPDEVYQFCGKYSHLEISSEDLAVYIARYKKFLLELHLDYIGRKSERKLELYCDDGTYVFDIFNSCISKNGNELFRYQESWNDIYIKEMEYFLALCNSKDESQNDLNHAIKVQKIATGNKGDILQC